jgi:hypothetical protein
MRLLKKTHLLRYACPRYCGSVGVPSPTVQTSGAETRRYRGLLVSSIQLMSVFALILALLAEGACAHDHWVDVASFYPGIGDTLEVFICSGHHFPESGQALEDKVVEGLRVWSSDEAPVLVESVVGEKRRTAMFEIQAEGVHVFDLTLKRPRAKAPSYEGKAIVVVNRLKDDPARYALGEGLELVPLEALSSVTVGDTLSIRLTLDGKPVAGSLQVVPENGRTTFVRTEEDDPGLIPVRTAGRYLVSAQVGARGASLVLDVPRQEAPAGKGGSIK